MKSLNFISTNAFANCTINEFDAPKLTNIFGDDDIKFMVCKKNFKDSPGII